MTTAEADPDTTRPVGRYEWENVLRRLSDPKQFSDELQHAGLMLATYADPDGTRVRPGEREFCAALRCSESTVRRRLRQLVKLGFVQMTARGGGAGPGRRSSEYRLTLPVDLLDRFAVREPGVHHRMSLVTQVTEDDLSSTGNSGHSRLTAVPELSPVDNSETQVTMPDPSSTEHSPELRSNNAVSGRNSGQKRPNSGHPMGGAHQPHTPTTKPTTTNPDPTQPDTACGQNPQPIDLAAVELGPRRCPHGLSRARRDDGTPRCPACRRGLPAGKDPT